MRTENNRKAHITRGRLYYSKAIMGTLNLFFFLPCFPNFLKQDCIVSVVKMYYGRSRGEGNRCYVARRHLSSPVPDGHNWDRWRDLGRLLQILPGIVSDHDIAWLYQQKG